MLYPFKNRVWAFILHNYINHLARALWTQLVQHGSLHRFSSTGHASKSPETKKLEYSSTISVAGRMHHTYSLMPSTRRRLRLSCGCWGLPALSMNTSLEGSPFLTCDIWTVSLTWPLVLWWQQRLSLPPALTPTFKY